MQPATPTRSSTRRLPLPTSFGGVAAVAEGPGSWLLVWQLVFALGTAVVSVWAFEIAWARAIQRAISSLPDQGRIHDGALEWTEQKPQILHQGPFVALVVDPQGLRENGLATDITLSLESDRLAFRSFLGWAAIRYPPTLRMPLTRLDLTSTLNAWRTPFLIALGAGTVLVLMGFWTALSLAYGLVVWISAAALGHPVPFRIARRLAGASLLPGCFLMTAAIALYATRQLGLPGLLVAVPLHIMLGWVYCAGSWTRLQRAPTLTEGQVENPFSSVPTLPTTKKNAPSAGRSAATNPFEPQG